jgi:hypothetical protein
MKVSFTFEEYPEADDNLLPCAVQEIEDHNTDTNDEEEAAACKPIPNCRATVQCLDTYHLFLSGIPDVSELSETSGTRKFYPIMAVHQDSKSVFLV